MCPPPLLMSWIDFRHTFLFLFEWTGWGTFSNRWRLLGNFGLPLMLQNTDWLIDWLINIAIPLNWPNVPSPKSSHQIIPHCYKVKHHSINRPLICPPQTLSSEVMADLSSFTLLFFYWSPLSRVPQTRKEGLQGLCWPRSSHNPLAACMYSRIYSSFIQRPCI